MCHEPRQASRASNVAGAIALGGWLWLIVAAIYSGCAAHYPNQVGPRDSFLFRAPSESDQRDAYEKHLRAELARVEKDREHVR